MKLFVSYSSRNRDQVKLIADDLSILGHEVWYDQKLTGGQEWWDSILDHILSCDVFLFVLTSEWLNSDPCKLEFDYAVQLKKHRLPIQASLIENYRTLPYEVQRLQIVNYMTPDKNSLRALANALTGFHLPNPIPDPLPQRPAAPISALSKITHELSQDTLSEDQQRSIFNRLLKLMDDPLEKQGAQELLLQLEKHADVSPAVLKEIAFLLEAGGSSASFKLNIADKNWNAAVSTKYMLIDAGSGQIFILDNSRVTVGRAISCDVVIQDPSFSRTHFALNWDEEKNTYIIVGTGACNPIRVNGQILTEPRDLAAQDEIACGQTVLKFVPIEGFAALD